eukprot:jgi/Tetstr1/455304/TSEL_042139.t1
MEADDTPGKRPIERALLDSANSPVAGGSAGKFQRLPDLEGPTVGPAGRARRLPSSDSYQYDVITPPPDSDCSPASLYLADNQPTITEAVKSARFAPNVPYDEVEHGAAGPGICQQGAPGFARLSKLADGVEAGASAGGHRDRGVRFPTDLPEGLSDGIQRQGTPGVALLGGLCDMACGDGDGGGVRFRDDVKPDAAVPSSIQRKGTPGAGLLGVMSDFACEAGQGAPGVSFHQDTKLETGCPSSIQRKGTPGAGLLGKMADVAREELHAGKAPSVSFGEGTKTDSPRGAIPSIERKGTPGAGLLCSLADMAEDEAQARRRPRAVGFQDVCEPSAASGSGIRRQGTPGVALLAGLPRTAESGGCSAPRGVRFPADTGEASGSGIRRQGTPGVGLVSSIADMAAGVTRGVCFAEDADRAQGGASLRRTGTPGAGLLCAAGDTAARCPTVSFTPDTKQTDPIPGAGIARKGTPGCGVVSHPTELLEDEEDGMADTAMPRSGVSFSRETKTGAGPSIQRKGTPGAGLLGELADMACDREEGASVSFSQGTKAEGSSLGRFPSIQRKCTPGAGLLGEMADIACAQEGASVSFSQGTKAEGSPLGLFPSIQRKGTPGAGLLGQLADMACDREEGASVSFSQGTKEERSPLARFPSIQRKGTPGAGLLGQMADMAEEAVQGGAEPMDDAMPESDQVFEQSDGCDRGVRGSMPPPPSAMSRRATLEGQPRGSGGLRRSTRALARFSSMPVEPARPVPRAELDAMAAEVSAICSRSMSESSPRLLRPMARRGSITILEDRRMSEPVVGSPVPQAPPARAPQAASAAVPAFLPGMARPQEDSRMEGITVAMAELGHEQSERSQP